MDDLISKRALLRHLDMAIECKDCPRNTDGITYQKRCACSEVSDICNIITDFATFTDVQPVNQWINVKDSVPETGIHVLVTDGIHMMVTWCEYVDNQCLWVDNYYEYVNVRFKEVTHWMPLPELPKEDDTNG